MLKDVVFGNEFLHFVTLFYICTPLWWKHTDEKTNKDNRRVSKFMAMAFFINLMTIVLITYNVIKS